MTTIVGEFMPKYYNYWDSVGDPRLQDWFLMKSPNPVLIIVTIYLLFCIKIGPKWMMNRKPFKLKNILIVYNLVQIVICSYIIQQGTKYAWGTKYKWFCEPVDYSMNHDAVKIATSCSIYFLMKLVDLLDTVFFVLRKKNNQITVLHLMHHSYMPVALWFAVKLRPGGSYTMFGLLNSMVHVCMYTYYLLAAMGPKIQKYLWWKKYLTTLQIGQFVLVLLHLIPHYFIKDCDVPLGFIVLIVVGAVSFLVLFLNFYRMEYLIKEQKLKQDTNGIKSKSG